MRLLLIRHGQTPSNVAGALDTGRPGPGLTPLGHTQAAAIPAALADEPISSIHVSPLIRTHLTATPLAEARSLALVEQEGLEEISAGRWEMQTSREAVSAYVGAARRWLEGDLDHVLDGGESGRDFYARYDAAIARVAEAAAGGTAVAVSHGAAIRVWAAGRVSDVDREETVHWRLDNTGMCALDGDPGSGWRLIRWEQDPLGGAALED